jgi:uncharacterized protein (DUF952 family)
MPTTFHLVPDEAWDAAAHAEAYAPASLATEGFIHCTDGVEALGETFDRYYAGDGRPFLALTVDLDALEVPWRYDVPGSPYPHVYGPIAHRAVVEVRRVARHEDGRFRQLVPEPA